MLSALEPKLGHKLTNTSPCIKNYVTPSGHYVEKIKIP